MKFSIFPTNHLQHNNFNICAKHITCKITCNITCKAYVFILQFLSVYQFYYFFGSWIPLLVCGNSSLINSYCTIMPTISSCDCYIDQQTRILQNFGGGLDWTKPDKLTGLVWTTGKFSILTCMYRKCTMYHYNL